MNVHVAPDTAANPKRTLDLDRQVGQRITAVRKAKGLSQTALGQAIGVTFQQVQKYEKGQNRVGAGRLGMIARQLDVPITVFFAPEGADGDEASETGAVALEAFGLLAINGAPALLKAFAAIEDEELRRGVLSFVRHAATLRPRHDAASAEA